MTYTTLANSNVGWLGQQTKHKIVFPGLQFTAQAPSYSLVQTSNKGLRQLAYIEMLSIY